MERKFVLVFGPKLKFCQKFVFGKMMSKIRVKLNCNYLHSKKLFPFFENFQTYLLIWAESLQWDILYSLLWTSLFIINNHDWLKTRMQIIKQVMHIGRNFENTVRGFIKSLRLNSNRKFYFDTSEVLRKLFEKVLV